MVLVVILLILANIVSIPFILLGVSHYSSTHKNGPASATAKFSPKLSGRLQEIVGTGLREKLEDVSVKVVSGVDTTEVTVKNLKGSAEPSKYEEVLKNVLGAKSQPTKLPRFQQDRSLFPGVSELLTEPLVLIGGVLAVQGSILLIWLVGRKAYFKGPRELPPFHRAKLGTALLVGVLMSVPVAFLSNLLDTTLRQLMNTPGESVWEAVSQFPAWGQSAVVASGVIGAPILEEIFFRGMLIGLFIKIRKPWVGVALSSVAFGLAHLQDVPTVLSITAMGLVLGTVYVKTKSIYATITIHMLNNAYAFAMLLMAGK